MGYSDNPHPHAIQRHPCYCHLLTLFFITISFCFFSELILPMECAGELHPECRHKNVILAIWIIAFLQAAVVKSMGVLLPGLLDQFAAHTRNVGVVLSLTFFCGNFIGKFLCARQLIQQILPIYPYFLFRFIHRWRGQNIVVEQIEPIFCNLVHDQDEVHIIRSP